MMFRCDDLGFGWGDSVLRWDELLAVGIRTSSDGPFAEDCFWQLLLQSGACLELPAALMTGDALAAWLERLPGADLREVVEAMGSVEERVFRIWHADESAWQWDSGRLGARFTALVERLGGDSARSPEAFERLVAAWSAPERRYHDREHLLDCLRELDTLRAAAASSTDAASATGAAIATAVAAATAADIADIAELALWYHDAIYEPGARNSEDESARLLLETAHAVRIPAAHARAAAACVRATAHGAEGGAPSAPMAPCIDLVLDIDLSILGRDALRFLEFEYAVAEEYARVPRAQFILARGRFLQALLAAPIYRTPHFRARYEQRARANLVALLASPRYRLHRWASRVRRCFSRG